jgi:hypothetical protein
MGRSLGICPTAWGAGKIYLIDAVAIGLFGFLYFGMVDTAIPSAVFIAIVLSLILHYMQYGPQAALIAEAFTPRLRYSGSSPAYQLASVITGGPPPHRHGIVRHGRCADCARRAP